MLITAHQKNEFTSYQIYTFIPYICKIIWSI